VPVLEDEHVKCFIQLNWEGVVEHIIENAMCNSVQFQRKNWVNALINAARYGRVNMVRMILVRRPNYVDVQYGRALIVELKRKHFHVVRVMMEYGASMTVYEEAVKRSVA
jgi:hypothetical protein